MKICPTCRTKYSTNVFYCPLEGSKLEDDIEAGPSKSIIGTILDDRYRIVAKLGEGGMGAVYMVEHVILKKQMAAKILRDEFARKEDLVKRFQMEAVAASRIGQENIVDVTDFGRTGDGNVYFVMEVLDGPNLAQLIKQEGGIGYARAVPILMQVCRALHSAHRQGIIHRDLKPENIVLIKRGENPDFVKILDFGISKMIDVGEGRTEKLTALGMIVGTPEYMSPEQASGAQVDLRTDIYSLGVIMYEMVTGRLPFTADNALRILMMHQTEAPVPPRTLRPDLDIPMAVEGVVLKAMAKKRELRQASMEEVMNDLVAAVTEGRPQPQYEPRKTMAWDSAVGALPGINLSGVTPIGTRRPSKTESAGGARTPASGPTMTPIQQPPIQIAVEAAPAPPQEVLRPGPTPAPGQRPLSGQMQAVAAAPRQSVSGQMQAAPAAQRQSVSAQMRAAPAVPAPAPRPLSGQMPAAPVKTSAGELECYETPDGHYCESQETALERDVREEQAAAGQPAQARQWQETTAEVEPRSEDVTVVAPPPRPTPAPGARPVEPTTAPRPAAAAPSPAEFDEPIAPARGKAPIIIAVAAVVVLLGGVAAAYFTGMLGGKPAPVVAPPVQAQKVEPAKPAETSPAKAEPAVDFDELAKAAQEKEQDDEPGAAPQPGKKGKKKDVAAQPAGEVVVDLATAPSTVEVYRGGNFVGITPTKLRGKKGDEEVITFKKTGFETKTVSVRYDRPRAMKVDLKEAGGKPAAPPGKKKDDLFDKIDDIKNPFK